MSTNTEHKGTHNWTVDSAHSSVDFTIRHLGVFTVKGSVGTLSGTGVSVDGKLSTASLTIDVTAFSTNHADRDAHVKSPDFLNVEKYPTITFVSTSIASENGTNYVLTGDLTIAGETKPITVEAEAVPPVTDPWGNFRAGLTGSGSLKRSEYGVKWNSTLENGHLVLSDEIKFTFDVQAILVKE